MENDANRAVPSKILLAQLADDIEAAYKRGLADGYDKGFREGEAKQAILEMRGRDAFLKELRANNVLTVSGGRENTDP